MGTVRYYLKKPGKKSEKKDEVKSKKKTGKRLIYLQFRYNGRKLVFSFGQTVDPKSWDPSLHHLKTKSATTADGTILINELLHNLAKECLLAYNTEIKDGIPQPAVLKRYLIRYMNRRKGHPDDPTLKKLMKRFTDGEIKYRGQDKSKNTIQNYNTVVGHMEEYETAQRCNLDFADITLDFYYKYVSFLKSKGLHQNSISKDIQTIKVFMNEAVDLGFSQNMQFRHKKFNISRLDTDSVFLTEEEILKLYRHDFSNNKKLEQVRDLFVFGCFVGLRFSDYSVVKPENIVQIDGDRFIKLITKKTKELVIIPCNPVVLKIFDKYKVNANHLPNSISNQKFNDYIKEACQEAKLTETGRLSTGPTLELWQCVSSHTARRSFATNYYLQGFPTIDLMKITGHKTEKAFLKYIRVTKLDTAKRLSEHIKKNWSQMMLRIA